jgi:hypothetical protein
MRPRLIRAFVAAGAAALFLFSSQQASADNTLNLAFQGTTGVATLTVTLDGSKMTGVEPGPYFFNVNPPPSGGGSPISTFCMELGQGVNSGAAAPYAITPLNSPTGTTISANNSNVQGVANALEALYGFYYQTAWNTGVGSNIPGTSTPLASAFQLAIWELIYDGTKDLTTPNANNFFTSGNFQVGNCSAEQEAQVMLNNVLNNINAGISDFSKDLPGETLVALTNPTYQDQLWLEPTPKVVPSVPAPPGILLAGFGLVALFGRARWNRRTPVPA